MCYELLKMVQFLARLHLHIKFHYARIVRVLLSQLQMTAPDQQNWIMLTGGRRAKSTEIIFTNSKRKHAEGLSPQIPDIRRVTTIKMLGVTITNHLSAGEHVRNVIGRCAQSLHALKLLRYHGMSDDSFKAHLQGCRTR